MDVPDHDAVVYLGHSLQVSLGIVFAAAVVSKLRGPHAFAKTVEAYEIVPPLVAHRLAFLVLAIEAFLAVMLVTGWLASFALHIAALTILAFTGAVTLNLWRGRRITCGCFGNPGEEITSRSLARLVLLLVGTVILLVVGYLKDESVVTLSSMSGEASAVLAYLIDVSALSAALIAVGMWALNTREASVAFPFRQLNRRRAETVDREVGAG